MKTEESLATFYRRSPLLLTALGVALLSQIQPWWEPSRDAASYLSIARDIAAGGPVQNLGEPQLFVAPGYPVLISPTFWLGDRPFLFISILHYGLCLLLMVGVHRWARRLLGDDAVPVTLLVMVNVNLLLYARRTLSELAFMTLLVWTALVLHSLAVDRSAKGTVVKTGVAALLMVALCLTRQTGIFLAAGFGVFLLIGAWRARSGWGRAIVVTLIVGLIPSAAILGLGRYESAMAEKSRGTGLTYAKAFEGDGTSDGSVDGAPPSFLQRSSRAARLRISEIGRLTVPGMFKAYGRRWLNFNTFLYSLVLVVLVVGWWRLARRQADILVCMAPFYIGFYFFWPWDQGTRFYVPMLPVLAASLLQVLAACRRFRLRLVTVLLVGHVAVSIAYLVPKLAELRELDEKWPQVERISRLVTERRDAVLVRGDKDTRKMGDLLEFELDRRITEAELGGEVPADIEWIVQSEAVSPVEGFEVHAVVDGYSLSRRTR